jgi:cytochrome c-type biogenesis protein CcmH
MMSKKLYVAIALALGFGFLAVGIVYAQQLQPTPSDDQVNAIARQLYCPVCENTPLDVCPTIACAQWRELIRQELSAGWTEQAIKDYFVQRYGARVLGSPPPKGLNLLVYIIPPLAFLAGVYVLFRAYRTWKRPTPQVETAPSTQGPPAGKDASQDEYYRRLEEEIRKR